MYISMPLVVYIALRKLAKIEVAFWCFGGTIFGLGLLAVGLRGAIPDWVSYELAVLLVFFGTAIRIESLRGELGRPRHNPALLLTVAAFWLGYVAVLKLSDSGLKYAFYWSFFWIALGILWMAGLAKQLHRTQSLSSALWLAIAYVPLGALMLIRVAAVLLGYEQYGPIASSSLTPIVSVAATIACALANTAYLGMYIERDSQSRIIHAKLQARREENERLSGQIAHLDRQRGLGLLAESLAHEISQPLTNIRLIAGLAQVRPDPSTASIEANSRTTTFTDILRNLDLASAVLNRIRSFVRSAPPQRQDLRLDEIADNAIALMDDWLRSEGTTTRLHKEGGPLSLTGDHVQISQILVNLLRNAAQATAGSSKREIDVTIARDGDWVIARIRDSGSGFSDEALQRGITSFVSSKSDGLGLGLSISQQIAELHGGSIQLANHPLGGAELTLRLPFNAPTR